ncbi:MAG: hypothetical protein CMQ43_11020 [Gammaproteobacteria bacterium]|jgi:two-component system phosphate regulon response regulator PhoB|nr:hypothetical protein [Gammaproteobacteria bacterium]|tara:strand:+ start:5212 stop:5601 length:390 start_codon:yes stop_codon:yes gene_type:complete
MAMKKILIVEDDQKISMAIGMSLRAMGYVTVTATDAVTATAQARKERPDVVIMDINLPAGDGFTVAERMQNIVDTANTPIVFITASKQPGLRERAESLGAAHFLEKPFEVGQLADAVETACQATSGPIG